MRAQPFNHDPAVLVLIFLNVTEQMTSARPQRTIHRCTLSLERRRRLASRGARGLEPSHHLLPSFYFVFHGR